MKLVYDEIRLGTLNYGYDGMLFTFGCLIRYYGIEFAVGKACLIDTDTGFQIFRIQDIIGSMTELIPFTVATQIFFVPALQLPAVKAIMICQALTADGMIIQVILLKKTQILSKCAYFQILNSSYGKNSHYDFYSTSDDDES